MHWQEQLRTEGYTIFPGLIPPSLVSAALAAIANDLRTNYKLECQAEYDNLSYCPDLRGNPSITDLLVKSAVYKILDDALGIDQSAWDGGQIAIRKAHNHHAPIPPEPHIDGFSSGLNGLKPGRVYNHTLLVGVFLTPIRRDFVGNFTVWPQSHHLYESYFRERGPQALTEPTPKPPIGDPVQLKCEVGDVVLAHYQVGHTAAVNTSDIDRVAVYFRVWLRSPKSEQWKYLTHIWKGWRI
jgi:ectoine hydroxylase-related dioxygenase (phytanoyl-CoA dioxygenase family)